MPQLPFSRSGFRLSLAIVGLFLVLVTPIGCVSTTSQRDTSGMSFSRDPLVGKIIWNDLITEDLAASKRFYENMFDWTFQDTTSSDGRPYALAKSGNVYVAGLLGVEPRRDGQKVSRWLPYASVQDVDAAVDRMKEAKGSLPVPARDVRIGRVAVIVDREGAVMGLLSSRIGDPDDATTKAAPGRVVLTELLSNNPSAAADFYHSVIGYDPRTVERRGGQYTLLTHDGVERAGILKNPTENWSPDWLTYFGVKDPAAAAARAEILGGKILLPVSPQIREGTIAVVTDPTGAVLVLQKVST
ncbi:MAG TPA: VOC family protein [Steroidobacteraceae bacterium]|nr:VOC family protein [Steroidobacteraceae bacterium]